MQAITNRFDEVPGRITKKSLFLPHTRMRPFSSYSGSLRNSLIHSHFSLHDIRKIMAKSIPKKRDQKSFFYRFAAITL